MIANAWFLDCTKQLKCQYSAVSTTLSVQCCQYNAVTLAIFLILNIVKKIKSPEAASRAVCFMLVSYLAYSLTVNVEALSADSIGLLTTAERTAGSISSLIMSSHS